MQSSTEGLTLAADTPVNLQLHTHLSDGTWTPEALLDHLKSAGFGLGAVTDHDRVDTVPELQRLAAEKGMPLLISTELTGSWKGELTDFLCYGFDPYNPALLALTHDVLRRQTENSRMVFDNLIKAGCTFPDGEAEIAAIVAKPSSQHLNELFGLLERHQYGTGTPSAGRLLGEAGFAWAMTDVEVIVDTVHQSSGLCLIAHPGRDDGFVTYTPELLDELRGLVPIDGLEVHYPKHKPEQTAAYLEYAQKHNLLMSSGSDSHRPSDEPVKYRAELSRSLLERLGVRVLN